MEISHPLLVMADIWLCNRVNLASHKGVQIMASRDLKPQFVRQKTRLKKY